MRAMVLVASLAAAPASAKVVKAEAGGFEVASTVMIEAPAQQVWDALGAPARWWNAEHTYSGDAKNLSIDSRATGCFCEKLPDNGSIEHARIVYAQPSRMLRLHGALGPLQAEAALGTLTFVLTPEGSKATRVKMTYVVGGYIRSGAEAVAPAVDRVMTMQLEGLKAAAMLPPPS